MRSIRICFIALVACAILSPVGVTVFGGETTRLGGVTKKGASISFTYRTFIDGSFQRQFETRFSKGLSIFGSLVKIDNQLSLWLFRQVSSNPKSRVVLGNDGHLIERSYLPAFNRQGIPKKSKLVSVANQLLRLQTALNKRGKRFVLVISTNKPNYYPDLVPSWYRIAGAQEKASGYDTFLELLRQREVVTIDSRSTLHAAEASAGHAMFSPTGTHWNEYGACLVASELGRKIELVQNKKNGELECLVQGARSKPTDQEMDLLKITNLLYPNSLIRPGLHLISKVKSPLPLPERPKVLVIGTSFCWELLQVLNKNPLLGDREFLYYFQRQILSRGGRQKRINKDHFDILAAVERNDVVVFEVNEAFVHRVGYGFMDRAIKAMKEGRQN